MSSLFGFRSTASAKDNDGGTKSGFQASRMLADNPATIEDGSDNAMRRQLVHVLLRDALRRHGIPPEWIECQMLVVSSRSRGPGMYVRLVIKHWDQRLMNYAYAFQKTLVADIVRFEPQAAQWLHGISWQLEVAGSCPYLELPEKSFWQNPAPVAAAVPTATGTAPHANATQGSATAAATPTLITAEELAELAAAARQANAARRAAPGKSGGQAAFDSSPTEPAPLGTLEGVSAPLRNGLSHDLAHSEAAQDLERLFAIRDRELGQSSADGVGQVGYEKTRPSPL